MTKQIPATEHPLINQLKFHAAYKAPKQWKKRDKQSRYVYNLVVTLGIDLFEQGLMHPKQPDLLPAHYETIVHNIGRLVADEITSLNKFNLTNEIPLFMEQAIKHTLKQVKNGNKKSTKKVSRQASKSKTLSKKK